MSPGCQTLSVARSHREVEVLEPDQGDVRLAAVGAEPVAWAERDVLTIAVRQSGKAPSVVGTVSGSNARLTALPANGLNELLSQRARQCGRQRVSQ